MSDGPRRTQAVIASAAALAGLVGFALYQRSKSTGASTTSPTTGGSSVVSPDWTAAQVQNWLRTIVKASPAAVKAFADNDIDGDLLLSFNDHHLQTLGIVSLGDRLRISRAIEGAIASNSKLHADAAPHRPTTAPVAAAPTYSTSTTEDESTASSSTSASSGPATKQSSVEAARGMLASIEKIYTTFSGDSFQSASGDEQKRLVYACKLLFEDKVVAKLQQLTPEDLEKLAPSIEGTAEFLARVFAKINAATSDSQEGEAVEMPATSSTAVATSSSVEDSTDDKLPEELSATLLQRTIPIIRTFYQTLDSPDLLKAPAAERARICSSVAEEVEKIRKLANKLSAKHSEALLGVCDRVVSVAQERAAGRTDPSSSSPSSSSPATTTTSVNASTGETTASSGFLLQRLRSLYGVLSAPTFIQSLTEKTPVEVQRIAAKMTTEVKSITKDANALDDAKQRTVILEVVQQLSGILGQVTALGDSMNGGEGEVEEEESPAQEVNDARFEVPSSPVEISQALKTILQVIQTPKFQDDPTDDLPRLTALTHACITSIQKVEDAAVRQSLGTLAGKIKDMLGHAARIAFAGQKQREAAAGIVREEGSRNQQEERTATGRPSQQFQVVKETLEQVFTIISGDDFSNAVEAEKLQIIELLKEQMMKALNLIRTVVQDVKEQQSLLALWKSIVELLEKVTLSVTTSAAATQQDASAAAYDGSVADPSANSISIEDALQEVRNLYSIVQSEEYTSADPTNQVIISQGLYRDCSALLARINASPSDSEEGQMLHDKVKPLAAQLCEVLEGHLQNASTMTEIQNAQQDGGDEDVNDDEDNQDPRAGMFQCLVQATRILRERKDDIGMSELREIVGTLENVEEIGIQNEAEQDIRDDCAAAVQEVLVALESRGGAAIAEDAYDDEEEEEEGEEEEEEEEEGVERFTDFVASSEGEKQIILEMVSTIKVIAGELREAGPTFTSPTELLPFMNAAEDVIAQVENNNIKWQASPDAVRLVSALFTAIQNYQKQLNEVDRPTSQIEAILGKAHAALEKAVIGGQLRASSDLQPFLNIAATTQESEDELTVDDRKALMNFQKLLLFANSKIKSAEEERLQTATDAAAAIAAANASSSPAGSREPSQNTTDSVNAARKAAQNRNPASPAGSPGNSNGKQKNKKNNSSSPDRTSAPTQDEDGLNKVSPSKNSKGGVTEGPYDSPTVVTTEAVSSSVVTMTHSVVEEETSIRSSSSSSQQQSSSSHHQMQQKNQYHNNEEESATPVSRHNINAKSPQENSGGDSNHHQQQEEEHDNDTNVDISNSGTTTIVVEDSGVSRGEASSLTHPPTTTTTTTASTTISTTPTIATSPNQTTTTTTPTKTNTSPNDQTTTTTPTTTSSSSSPTHKPPTTPPTSTSTTTTTTSPSVPAASAVPFKTTVTTSTSRMQSLTATQLSEEDETGGSLMSSMLASNVFDPNDQTVLELQETMPFSPTAAPTPTASTTPNSHHFPVPQDNLSASASASSSRRGLTPPPPPPATQLDNVPQHDSENDSSSDEEGGFVRATSSSTSTSFSRRRGVSSSSISRSSRNLGGYHDHHGDGATRTMAASSAAIIARGLRTPPPGSAAGSARNLTPQRRRVIPPLATPTEAHKAAASVADPAQWTADSGEFVAGGRRGEIGLLPRIIERLGDQSGETFLSGTTLFEVMSIARLLRRLDSSLVVQSTKVAPIVRHTEKMLVLALHQGANDRCFGIRAEEVRGGLSTTPRGSFTSSPSPPTTPRSSAAKNNNFYSAPTEEHVNNMLDQLAVTTSPVCIDLKEVTKGPQEGVQDLPLAVTGMRSENELKGQDIYQYTIFSKEEDEYHVDKDFIAPLLQSEADDSLRSICDAIKPPITDELSYDYRETHHGLPMKVVNLAIVIGVSPSIRDGSSTIAAELTMMCDILDTEFAFDSVVITDDNLNSKQVEDVIRQAIRMNTDKHPIGRLLFFLRTDSPSLFNQRNFALTFTDGSCLSHRDLCGIVPSLEKAGELLHPVHQTLLIHDSDNALQVLAQNYDPIAKTLAYRYRCGPHVGVSLTVGAKSIANSSRCWLYDGLFTPIIGEMLTVGASHVQQLYLLEKSRNIPSSSVVPFHVGPYRSSRHSITDRTSAPSPMRREMHDLGEGSQAKRYSFHEAVAGDADPFCFRLCPEDIINYAIIALTKQIEPDRVSAYKADRLDPAMACRMPSNSKYARDIVEDEALEQGVLMSPTFKRHRSMQFKLEDENEFIHEMGNVRRRIQPPKVGRSVLHNPILRTGFFTNTTTENVVNTEGSGDELIVD